MSYWLGELTRRRDMRPRAAVADKPWAWGDSLIFGMEFTCLSLCPKVSAKACPLMLSSLLKMSGPSQGQVLHECRSCGHSWMASALECCWIDSSIRCVFEQDNLTLPFNEDASKLGLGLGLETWSMGSYLSRTGAHQPRIMGNGLGRHQNGEQKVLRIIV